MRAGRSHEERRRGHYGLADDSSTMNDDTDFMDEALAEDPMEKSEDSE